MLNNYKVIIKLLGHLTDEQIHEAHNLMGFVYIPTPHIDEHHSHRLEFTVDMTVGKKVIDAGFASFVKIVPVIH